MATAGAVTMAMGALNFGLFVKPIGDDLGIGRSTFGWAQTARQVSSSVTSPIVGVLLDRFGSRVLMAVAAAITGVSMVGLSRLDHGWQLVSLFAVMGLVGMSGPGALVTSVPVVKWFVRDRGRAIAFMSLGIPIGAVIFVPLTQVFIDAWGWRTAWIVLAAIGGGIIVPLSLLFVRRQPEDMGLLPDGAALEQEPPAASSRPSAKAVEEASWTVREAARSSAFWSLVAVFAIVSLAIGTFAVHRIPAFMDRGLDARLVSFATAIDAVCAGATTFTLGFLVGKYPAKTLGVAGFLLLTAACVLTIYATTVPLMFLSMSIFGAGIGSLLFLQNYLWADYFGRRHLGSIRGLVMPITLVIGGIGAPVAGYVRDATGSYNAMWWAGVGLLLVGALSLARTNAPERAACAPSGPPAAAPVIRERTR